MTTGWKSLKDPGGVSGVSSVKFRETQQSRREGGVFLSLTGWVGGGAEERRQQEAFRLFRFQWSSCHFLSAAASPASSPASASRTDNGARASTESWRVLLLPPLPPVGLFPQEFSKSLQLTGSSVISRRRRHKINTKSKNKVGSIHRARAPSPRLSTD